MAVGPTDRDVAAAAQRYRVWYTGTARLRAESVLSLEDELGAGAFAVLDPAFPRSYDSNKLVLPALGGPSLDPAVVMAVADDVLGSEGLSHRYVAVYDAVPDGWAEVFTGRGWQRQDLVGMVRDLTRHDDEAAGGPTASVPVVEVGEDRAAEFVAASWREEAPDFDDETVRQLVRRRVRLDRAGDVHRLAVEPPPGEKAPGAIAVTGLAGGDAPGGIAVAPQTRGDAPGGIAAQADLVVRGRTAELDAVGTLAAFRGRGYGDALVAHAARLALEAGADALVLEAVRDDWPRHWYARRGFTEVSPALTLTRPPHSP